MTSGVEEVLFVVGSSNQRLDDSHSTTRFALSLGLRFGNDRYYHWLDPLGTTF
jgi:hypothetical protein